MPPFLFLYFAPVDKILGCPSSIAAGLMSHLFLLPFVPPIQANSHSIVSSALSPCQMEGVRRREEMLTPEITTKVLEFAAQMCCGGPSQSHLQHSCVLKGEREARRPN